MNVAYVGLTKIEIGIDDKVSVYSLWDRASFGLKKCLGIIYKILYVVAAFFTLGILALVDHVQKLRAEKIAALFEPQLQSKNSLIIQLNEQLAQVGQEELVTGDLFTITEEQSLEERLLSLIEECQDLPGAERRTLEQSLQRNIASVLAAEVLEKKSQTKKKIRSFKGTVLAAFAGALLAKK